MDFFTNFLISTVAAIITITTTADGCSPPEGGWTEPTQAEIYHYTDHMVVGTVLSLITPDPVFGDMYGDSTYGARVQVRCAYKGGPVDQVITIHGAGFIPGHCTDKPLVVGKEYILFLDDMRTTDTSYSQTYPAEEYSSVIAMYTRVCDVAVTYTRDPGNSCMAADLTRPCKRYNVKKNKVMEEQPNAEIKNKPTITGRTDGEGAGNGYVTPVTETPPKTGASRNSAETTALSSAILLLCTVAMAIVRQ